MVTCLQAEEVQRRRQRSDDYVNPEVLKSLAVITLKKRVGCRSRSGHGRDTPPRSIRALPISSLDHLVGDGVRRFALQGLE
jgi:hypothetical protein